MARRSAARDMTVEEFDAWCAADDRVAEVARATGETGGPRLSLVPAPEQEIAWPTVLLPPPGGSRRGRGGTGAALCPPPPVAATAPQKREGEGHPAGIPAFSAGLGQSP